MQQNVRASALLVLLFWLLLPLDEPVEVASVDLVHVPLERAEVRSVDLVKVPLLTAESQAPVVENIVIEHSLSAD